MEKIYFGLYRNDTGDKLVIQCGSNDSIMDLKIKIKNDYGLSLYFQKLYTSDSNELLNNKKNFLL